MGSFSLKLYIYDKCIIFKIVIPSLKNFCCNYVNKMPVMYCTPAKQEQTVIVMK